jgi:hypothetical protein
MKNGNNIIAKKKNTMAIYTFQRSDRIPKNIRMVKSKELT